MGQANSTEVTPPTGKRDPSRHGNDPDRCGICRNLSASRTPRSLSCGHTFCHKCIKGVYKYAVVRNYRTKGSITCPVCQVVTQISDIVAASSVTTNDPTASPTQSTSSDPATMATTPASSMTNGENASTSVMDADGGTSTSASGQDSTARTENDHASTSDITDRQPSDVAVKTPRENETVSQTARVTVRQTAGETVPQISDTSTSRTVDTPAGTTNIPNVKSLKRRLSEADRDNSSADEEFHDSSQVTYVPAVARKEDAHLCSICINSKPKRKKTEVAFYCFDCTSSMCEGCKQKHDVRPRCRGHVCCAVTKDTITSLVCEQHQEFAEDYCLDCRSVTCAECHVTNHREHNIRDFTTQPVQSTVLRDLDQRRIRNQQTLSGLEQVEAQYMEELQNTREEMKRGQNNIICKVNAIFEDMFATLESERFKWNDKTQSIRSNVEEEMTGLDELSARCSRLMSPLAAIEGLHVRDAQELVAAVHQEIPQTSHVYTRPDTYLYVPEEGIIRCCGQLVRVPPNQLPKH